MTSRPRRRNIYSAVGENFARTRVLERTHHGAWIYPGTGGLIADLLAVPDFLNGWDNAGDPYAPMRFRWLAGGGLEIQGSVGAGTLLTAAFILPNDPIYRPDKELRFPASDNTGALVVVRVLPDGEVIIGV